MKYWTLDIKPMFSLPYYNLELVALEGSLVKYWTLDIKPMFSLPYYHLELVSLPCEILDS